LQADRRIVGARPPGAGASSESGRARDMRWAPALPQAAGAAVRECRLADAPQASRSPGL